jgi:endoribonuclease Dicer
MEQISLLIFDEAHHVKGNSSEMKIMEYYDTQQTGESHLTPRIFGMTASPIEGKEDFVEASKVLERQLKSKIATFPLSDDYKNNAQELTMIYDPLLDDFETPLYQQLQEQLGGMSCFARLFRTAKRLSSELGRWAADKYWQHGLRDEEAQKAQSRIEVEYRKLNGRSSALHDSDFARLKRAFEIVAQHEFGKATINLKDLSPKVLKLHEILSDYYMDDLRNRCIIFVEEKASARMLAEIFRHLEIKFLKPDFITGGATKGGDASVTARQQILTMSYFRKGDINCLFSTSVLEEGIDVPDCNIVIRFDLCKTVIKYIQSKGRARHRNSKFVNMVETDNFEHRARVHDAQLGERRLRQWVDHLDPERKLSGNDDLVLQKNVGRFFLHPRSDARLSYWNALTVLSLFTTTLVRRRSRDRSHIS